MPLLALRDVDARYGQVQALHGVSLTVDEGEIVVMLGANGAGKTTTLRAISGTVRRTAVARVRRPAARPRQPGETSPASASRTFPRAAARSPSFRCGRTCASARYTRRGPLKDDFQRVLGYFPWLESRRAQQAGTLSGGEQQMLALARALMQRPRLLLLDEPSLGLAPLVVAEIFRLVRELNEREGTAVLLVEQNARNVTRDRDPRVRPRGRLGRVRAGPSEELARTRARSAGATWATDGAPRHRSRIVHRAARAAVLAASRLLSSGRSTARCSPS